MTTYERAIQIHQVLIGAAHHRQVLNYEIVGKLIGVPHWGLAPHLEHLMKHCQRNHLPPLTALVVKKPSGKPGKGLTTVRDLDLDREKVFAHKWHRMRPLTVADLRAKL